MAKCICVCADSMKQLVVDRPVTALKRCGEKDLFSRQDVIDSVIYDRQQIMSAIGNIPSPYSGETVTTNNILEARK